MVVNPKEALQLVFTLVWFVGAASWLILVAEFLGVFLLQRWAFRFGPRAITREEEEPCPLALGVMGEGQTENLKYRVLEENQCLFRRKYKLFEVRFNTPLEIKGSISWKEGKLITVGRYPFGAMIFSFCFLVGWTAGSVVATTKGEVHGIPFLLIGWAAVGGMLIFSRWIEMKRFREYAAEMKSALGGNPDGIR